MVTERIEKNCHQFWLKTCGINTLARGDGYAQADTPWNAFSTVDVLVCTLWTDEIVSCFDDLEGRNRRFVKIGGKMKAWKGPAIKHGKEADDNLVRAGSKHLRVVGYEAKPNFNKKDPEARNVAYFYLDRAHELKRLFHFSDGEMLERLGVERAFAGTKQDQAGYSGYIFELVLPRGDFPGKDQSGDIAVGIDVGEIGSSAGDAEVSDFGSGDDSDLFDLNESEKASADVYAMRTLPILIAHVLQQRDDAMHTMTYKELAEKLGRLDKNGRPWARGLGLVLGKVTSMIDGLQLGWSETVPYLTTIVVGSNSGERGLPGVGIRDRWPGYETLSTADKHAKVEYEYKKILDFGSRWNEILKQLGLEPIAPPDMGKGGKEGGGGWGGGESDEHKALKIYVRDNPHLVGAEASWEASNEYALRSRDEIDVFFSSPSVWIGVEVKSRVSNGLDSDFERGLYQVVKYQALLEAQAQVDFPDSPPIVKVFLVLETELPKNLVDVAKRLNIVVKGGVSPCATVR